MNAAKSLQTTTSVSSVPAAKWDPKGFLADVAKQIDALDTEWRRHEESPRALGSQIREQGDRIEVGRHGLGLRRTLIVTFSKTGNPITDRETGVAELRKMLAAEERELASLRASAAGG